MSVGDVSKRILLGRKLRSSQLGETLLPKRIALPVFASDALSSVAYAPDAWGDGATWPMLTALAAGAVLVVDPRHRPSLGDAAVYATPDQARDVIDRLLADPPAFADQRARGDAYVRRELDTTMYGFFPLRAMAPQLVARLVHSADERIAVDDLELGVDLFRHVATTLGA